MPPSPNDDLSALLGSRICHDLISPLGAIGNGIELLMMSGTAPGPEMTLISDSVANANARIRFFRIAYGMASADQAVSRQDIRSILDDITRGGRLGIDWQVEGDPPRMDVKLAFLALQCMESALPHGGRVTVTRADGWRIEARADRLKMEPGLWARLAEAGSGAEISAAQVQFELLPQEIRRSGRKLSVEADTGRVAISY